MRNPLEILRKKLPSVINGDHNLIVSIISFTKSKKNYNRSCYYIFKQFHFNRHQIRITKLDFPIKKNSKYQDEIKYETVGDFLGNDPKAQLNTTYDIKRSHYDPINENCISKVLNFFNYKISINENIDTICITKNPENDVKILYDATGYRDVMDRFATKIKKTKRTREMAEWMGKPKFQNFQENNEPDEPDEPDDRELINKMHRMQLNEPAQPVYTFEFGKQKKSLTLKKLKLKKLKLDLKSIN